jgi:hypothetical protein
MAMDPTWCPFATRHDGPAVKTSGVRAGKGAVLHSAEGPLAASFRILALTSGARPADWQKSWHFTVAQDGRLFQHYPLDVVTWHAGPKANPLYVGVEHEGVAGQPVAGPQLEASARLLRWISDVEGWGRFVRYPADGLAANLFEHNQFMATACPSGRIPWPALLALLQGPRADPSPAPSFPEGPSAGDVALALASAATFVRMGWDLADLVEPDKAAIHWLAGRL